MNEPERSLRQQRIDAGKTADERNRYGQFATAYPLAVKIIVTGDSIIEALNGAVDDAGQEVGQAFRPDVAGESGWKPDLREHLPRRVRARGARADRPG